jgi:hypothetical protein
VEQIGRSGFGFRVDTRTVVHPKHPVPDQSDRYGPTVQFFSGKRLGEFPSVDTIFLENRSRGVRRSS